MPRVYILLLFLGLLLPEMVSAATLVECQKISPAHRPATESDLVVKNSTIPVGTCYNPAQAGVSVDELEAKEYLKSLPKQWAGGSTYDCKTYEDKNIDKLNGSFAMCMARFLKAYTAQYGPKSVRITSAYRSHDEQVCVCKGERGLCGRALPVGADGRPMGGSGVGHQYGTAMDIHPNNGNYGGFHQFALPFGVHFRRGMEDKPHVEPRTSDCGRYGTAPPGGYQSNLPATGGAYTTPSSGVADAIRKALGFQTAQPSVPQPSPIQPYAQTQPVLNAFATPSQTVPASGVGAIAITPASSDTSAIPSVGGGSENLFGDIIATSATGSTLADKLHELAFGVSTGGVTSGIPFIPLAINQDDRSDRAASTTGYAQLVATRTADIFTNTTFFDSGKTGYPISVNTLQQNDIVRVLASLRVALLTILDRLQPFYSQGNI
jgi:hypothetical protein